MYTIGQVSEMFVLPVSTIRHYDKEGLFPEIQRSSGIRKFSEKELETLRVIGCMKGSGLEIRDIRQFMQWCQDGSEDGINKMIPDKLPEKIQELYDFAHNRNTEQEKD